MPSADVPIYANRAPQLLASDGLRIRDDVFYTNAKGEDHERSRKRAVEALVKLKDILPAVMEPNETILYILRCQAPVSFFEQFTLGWYIYRITSTTLVFTNLRLLHLGVTPSGKWRRSLRSVRWGDIAAAKVKGWISKLLALKYANGKKENYWRLGGRDGKKVKSILAAVIPASSGESTAAQGMIALCPDCCSALSPSVYQCQKCGLLFKDEKTLLKRVLLIPGGGYFYAGVPFFGVLSLLGEGLLTLELIILLLQALRILPVEAQLGRPVPTSGELWVSVAIIALLLGLEKLITYRHGRRIIRSFLPLKRPGEA